MKKSKRSQEIEGNSVKSDTHSRDHHEHHHHDVSNISNKKLLWVTLLNLLITTVQIIGGVLSHSLSLLSDAVHNLGDSSAIFIAFLAGIRSKKNADEQHTFGYKRIEILAALFNAAVLIAICLFLFYEAYDRFLHPEPIKGLMMFTVATLGLFGNLISIIILRDNKENSLNIQAAYLHLMGDTLSSVAVIIGGIAIWKYHIYWIDPLITILVGIYIIYQTWGVLKETVTILMQTTPSDIDVQAIKREVEKITDVDNMHHLHIWKLDEKNIHLETHINLTKNMDMIAMMKIKTQIEQLLKNNFSINHITLQIAYECTECTKQLIVEQENK